MSAGVVVGILVGLWVLFRVVGRQITGSLVSQRSLMLMPAILLIIGLLPLPAALGTASTGEIAFLVLDCVVLVALGLCRGASLHLTRREDGLYQKGTGATLALWIVTLGIRIGAAFAAPAIWPHGTLNHATLALTIGLTIAAQNAMIYRRALSMHIPLAAERA